MTKKKKSLSSSEDDLVFIDCQAMPGTPDVARRAMTPVTTSDDAAAAAGATSSMGTPPNVDAALRVTRTSSGSTATPTPLSQPPSGDDDVDIAAAAAAGTSTSTATATTATGAASAASVSSGAARRAPRVPPTYLPPDLPAVASEVTNLASLSRVVTLLSTIIVKAVHDGKSVTASNKRLIALAAEETRRAMATFERLSPEPIATCSTTTITATHAVVNPADPTTACAATAAAAAAAAPISTYLAPPASVSTTDELRRELSTCIKEVRMLRGELSAATALASGNLASSSSSYALIAKRPIPVHAPTDARRLHSASATTQPQKPPSSKPAILISTKTPVGTRQEAVEAFRRSISFREAKYAPSKVSPLSKNKLRVEFDSPQDCEDALRRLQGSPSSQVTAEPIKKLKPMFIFKGISEDMPVEDLVGVVLGQNVELERFKQEDIAFKFRRNNNRNTKLYNAVFVASPQLFRAVVQMGRVRVDHQRVHAEEFSPFLQCHSCLQFGHVKKHCRSDQKRCAHCSDNTHAETECPTKGDEHAHILPKCYNCIAHNSKFPNKLNTLHKATSHSCPILKTVRDKISSTIDYGI